MYLWWWSYQIIWNCYFIHLIHCHFIKELQILTWKQGPATSYGHLYKTCFIFHLKYIIRIPHCVSSPIFLSKFFLLSSTIMKISFKWAQLKIFLIWIMTIQHSNKGIWNAHYGYSILNCRYVKLDFLFLLTRLMYCTTRDILCVLIYCITETCCRSRGERCSGPSSLWLSLADTLSRTDSWPTLANHSWVFRDNNKTQMCSHEADGSVKLGYTCGMSPCNYMLHNTHTFKYHGFWLFI